MQYYVSFRLTTLWVHIYILSKVIHTKSSNICHCTKFWYYRLHFLRCTLYSRDLFYNWSLYFLIPLFFSAHPPQSFPSDSHLCSTGHFLSLRPICRLFRGHRCPGGFFFLSPGSLPSFLFYEGSLWSRHVSAIWFCGIYIFLSPLLIKFLAVRCYCLFTASPIWFLTLHEPEALFPVPLVYSLKMKLWAKDWQTFAVKGQIKNISDFAGHTVSVATTQLCHCDMKEAVDNT